MEIPFFSLKTQSEFFKTDVLESIEKIIDDNSFILGNEVTKFEDQFSSFCDSNYSLGVSNGTAALLIALQILNIKKGDEVILPAATFAATAFAVAQLGAIPIFVDINEDTWLIHPKKIEAKITNKTKAIIVVHLYGNPCDMDAITALAQKHNIPVIEDAAQAHGALFNNKKIGSFGDISCFSFYPSKNLGAMGDAGAIVFQNNKYLEKALAIRNCGKDFNGEHSFIGFNYRMNTFQAAVLNHKLPYLKEFNDKRIAIADYYKTNIVNKKVGWQKTDTTNKNVYHLFVLKVDDREKFVEHLKHHKVGFSFHYKQPVHHLEAFNYLETTSLPITEDLFSRCVSIPLYPELSPTEMERVVAIINAY